MSEKNTPWWELLDPTVPDPVVQTLYTLRPEPEDISEEEKEFEEEPEEEFEDDWEDEEHEDEPSAHAAPSGYGGYFARIDEVQARPDARRDWLVEGLLPLRYLAVLGGAPKAGKTTFATALAYAVAAGKPFAGRKVEQGPVLYWSLEENTAERTHLAALAPKGKDGEPIPFYFGSRPVSLEDRQFLEILQAWFLKLQPVLIVVDSLHAACRMGTLADNHRARSAMTLLKRLADWSGATILLLHHTTKSASRGPAPDRFSDSAQILAVASMHIHLESTPLPPLKDAPNRTATTLTLAGRGLPLRTEIGLESRTLLDYIPGTPDAGDPAPMLVALLEERPLTAAELAAALDLTPTHVRRLLNTLVAQGLVEPPESHRRHRRFAKTDAPSR